MNNSKRKGDTKVENRKELWEVKYLSVDIPLSRHSHWLEIICQDPLCKWSCGKFLWCVGRGLSIIMRRMGCTPPTHPSALCIWQPHAVNCPYSFSQLGYESEGQPCTAWGWELPPHNITEEWVELSQQVGGPLRLLSDFQREKAALQSSVGKASWTDAQGGKNNPEKHYHSCIISHWTCVIKHETILTWQ